MASVVQSIYVTLPTNYDQVSFLDPLQISKVWYPYYRDGAQEGDNIQFCLKTNMRIVTESVHIHVKTSHTTEYTHIAMGKINMQHL